MKSELCGQSENCNFLIVSVGRLACVRCRAHCDCSHNSVLLQLNHKLMCVGRLPNRAINQIVLFLCMRDVKATNKQTAYIGNERCANFLLPSLRFCLTAFSYLTFEIVNR